MHDLNSTISGKLPNRIIAIGVYAYYVCVMGSIVVAEEGKSADHRHRLVVSTDIGGTDPDDFQSMVHLLVYAASFDIEGLISSPYGPGRKKQILQVIEAYAHDYPNLQTYSEGYPTPDALRRVCKQGSIETPGGSGIGNPTEGSEWIIRCAKRDDSLPLHVLVWGGIEDLAQALHDAPEIAATLRVYWIGGPNKKWSADAYNYIEQNHPKLWMIEANSTYRGWFVGGNQTGEWGNKGFVTQHIAGKGALGDFFAKQLGGTIKMGDTPSVGWLLKGTPEDPSQPSWGGQFVRAWQRPLSRHDRLTTTDDRIDEFSILELVLPMGNREIDNPGARLLVENQSLVGQVLSDGTIRFRFCPKAAKTYKFTISSNVAALDGKTGGVTSVRTSPNAAKHPDPHLPNWWTDDPSPEVAEGGHIGAKTVSKWRQEFLRDFSARMDRCARPLSR